MTALPIEVRASRGRDGSRQGISYLLSFFSSVGRSQCLRTFPLLAALAYEASQRCLSSFPYLRSRRAALLELQSVGALSDESSAPDASCFLYSSQDAPLGP